MLNTNDPTLRPALCVIKTDCGKFFAIDNSCGYPCWVHTPHSARVYSSVERARSEWESLKTALYNNDKEVYPSIVELMYSEKTKLSF